MQNVDFSFAHDCGFTAPVSFGNRLQLISAVWRHFSVYGIHAELMQMRDGLMSTLNFRQLLEDHPRAIRKLLAAEEAVPLTSDHLLDIFIPVYSEVGSNTRRTEEQLMKHFCTLLEEIENGQYRITLSQVLSFVTGAAAVPPTGFSPQPNIHFVDRNPCLPYSSTCSNTLFVPLHLATDYRTFADRMILVVGDCFGFGQV